MDLRVGQLPKIRVLPRPESGLRTLVERAPEAEVFADRLMERCRPAFTWFYGVRRKSATVAVLVMTAWLFVHIMLGANGMVVFREKRAEYRNLQAEIDSLQKENDRFNRQIGSLSSDPKAIEKEAREKLHYARPGEIVYFAPGPATPQARETKAAQK